jgi:DNA-binding response OmpR family regulator
MRVLIAGSDAEFLEVVQSYLARHGHEGKIATDGLECIAMLRDVRPDVLVLESDLLWGGTWPQHRRGRLQAGGGRIPADANDQL